MKYIKLKKNHHSGTFTKGAIIKIPNESFDKWMSTGIAEKSTKSDYEKYKSNGLEKIDEDISEANESQDLGNE